jgi:hypothetical protein
MPGTKRERERLWCVSDTGPPAKRVESANPQRWSMRYSRANFVSGLQGRNDPEMREHLKKSVQAQGYSRFSATSLMPSEKIAPRELGTTNLYGTTIRCRDIHAFAHHAPRTDTGARWYLVAQSIRLLGKEVERKGKAHDYGGGDSNGSYG